MQGEEKRGGHEDRDDGRSRLRRLERLHEILRKALPEREDGERLSRLALTAEPGPRDPNRSTGGRLLETAREMAFASASSEEWMRGPFARLARQDEALTRFTAPPARVWDEGEPTELALWLGALDSPALALLLHAILDLACLPPELDDILCLPSGSAMKLITELLTKLGLPLATGHRGGKACWPLALRIYAGPRRHPSCPACLAEARRARILARALARSEDAVPAVSEGGRGATQCPDDAANAAPRKGKAAPASSRPRGASPSSPTGTIRSRRHPSSRRSRSMGPGMGPASSVAPAPLLSLRRGLGVAFLLIALSLAGGALLPLFGGGSTQRREERQAAALVDWAGRRGPRDGRAKGAARVEGASVHGVEGASAPNVASSSAHGTEGFSSMNSRGDAAKAYYRHLF